MMKVGFQINNTTKKKKVLENNLKEDDGRERNQENDEEETKKEALLSIEGNVLKTNNEKESKPLVIPLIQPNYQQQSQQSQSLEDIAAKELLNDLKQSNSTTNSNGTLIIETIGINGTTNKRNEGENVPYAPLLLANVAPELRSITNDEERFKVDVSLRADDLDVKSSRYQDVPIEQFGAAMLRGMGWTGPSPEDENDDKKYKVVPREVRLGLGATPKPPDEKKKGRHDHHEKKKEKEKVDSWKRKAEEHLEKQKLYVDDVVTLLAPVEVAGSRGIIIQTTGVPGINKVKLSLERDGSEIIIDKKDLVLVTDQDLKEKPFKRIFVERRNGNDEENDREDDDESEEESKKKSHKKKSHKRDRQERGNDYDDRDNRDNRDSRDHRDSRDRDHDRDNNSNRSKKSKHERDSASSNNYNNNNSNNNSHSTTTQSSNPAAVSSWLQTGIRVKIITKKDLTNRSSYYLSKGTVLDVYYPSKSTHTSKQATIRLDSGVVLQDISEKYLETVLPKKKGEQCMILTGEHRGLLGNLLELDYDRNEVTVQLEDNDLDVLLLSMDSVAAIR